LLRLEPIIEGNPRAPTLFFVQGWPDDLTLWDEQVALLSPHHRCVRVDLPNYGRGPRVRRGYRTDEIVEALAECIQEVSPEAPVTLIAHDWGAYWGYMLHHRYPDRIARLVGLDVAPHYRPTLGAALGIVAYQSWLWAAFAIGGPVGNAMTRLLARIGKVPREVETLDASMNYPYRNAWHDLVSGRLRRATHRYWPRVPLLFVYGEHKPFHFHSRNWLDYVESQPGGKVIGLPCDHWVTRAPGFNELLQRWLSETSASLNAKAAR
jgi:pimeloyl-ACP methyl ester carboxylesterase